jgi:hypothetical protein
MDKQKLEALVDPVMKQIVLFNLTQKQILSQQLKTLRVVESILNRLAEGEPFSSACVHRTDLEEQDPLDEVFMRRMGMRNYFKELKMNL